MLERLDLNKDTKVSPEELLQRASMTFLRFDADGRVVYHQDYWNAADGLFQHIPVLGTLINAIKRRL